MEPFTLEAEQYFTIKKWVKYFPDLTVGFTTKNGGNSKGTLTSLNMAFHVDDEKNAVIKNRENVAKELLFPLNNWVGAQQTHETKIKVIKKNDKGKGAFEYDNAFCHTDGFFTMDKGILLTLCFADCVPLYFLHPQTEAIGIAHAGWKGTVGEIAREMIQVFKENNICVNDIQVVIGPAITEKHYIVDDRVIDEVKKMTVDRANSTYQKVSSGQYQLNLQDLNKYVLINAGVREENIAITKYCTYENSEHFYSHRRDHGKTGRMMSYIGFREEV